MSGGERLFGTDGIRGAFGEPPLDEATVVRLGFELGRQLAASEEGRSDGGGVRVVIGGDTRDSTPTLARWLIAGLEAAGAATSYLGTVPTPLVAHAARRLGTAAGVALSASHNLHPDNGIKLLDGRGFKWSPAAEARLEARLRQAEPPPLPPLGTRPEPPPRSRGADVEVETYLGELAASVGGGRPLAGLHLALDTANGAASALARGLFEDLGAEVTLEHAEPDGRNINRGCGSTHPEVIAELTTTTGADLGFAFDGDADRVVLADERGEIRDGDAVLYLWARELHAAGRLPGARIVATSMSNLGLEVALERLGIGVVRCDVGDREVVETMVREGIDLGGEQSGHVVYLPLTTTGDGLLAALRMAALRAHGGRPLSAMLGGFERFPQLIKNVRVASKPPLETVAGLAEARREVERELGREGRLVLRYSGTEPLARIMLEGPDRRRIEAMADTLAGVLSRAIGAG